MRRGGDSIHISNNAVEDTSESRTSEMSAAGNSQHIMDDNFFAEDLDPTMEIT